MLFENPIFTNHVVLPVEIDAIASQNMGDQFLSISAGPDNPPPKPR
jgi:hypothetical protein